METKATQPNILLKDQSTHNFGLDKIVKTESSDAVALTLRATLGLVMLPHGAQKLLGWFGGFGYSNTIAYFTETIGLPWILAFLFIIAESIGSILLILGAGTRVVAGIFAIIMVGAAYTHSSYGFFMNWFNNQQGEGVEFHILMFIISMILLFRGGGKRSVDLLLSRKG
jgi:putative oxidoreductase